MHRLGIVIPLVWLLTWVPPTRAAGSSDDVASLASLIDRRLAAGWEEAGVEAAPPASDAEFLRRVALDIAGRIPSVVEARAFLDDPAT